MQTSRKLIGVRSWPASRRRRDRRRETALSRRAEDRPIAESPIPTPQPSSRPAGLRHGARSQYTDRDRGPNADPQFTRRGPNGRPEGSVSGRAAMASGSGCSDSDGGPARSRRGGVRCNGQRRARYPPVTPATAPIPRRRRRSGPASGTARASARTRRKAEHSSYRPSVSASDRPSDGQKPQPARSRRAAPGTSASTAGRTRRSIGRAMHPRDIAGSRHSQMNASRRRAEATRSAPTPASAAPPRGGGDDQAGEPALISSKSSTASAARGGCPFRPRRPPSRHARRPGLHRSTAQPHRRH